jgi:type III secretory pathway component EscS
MGKKKNRYSISDHIFAIAAVLLMCVIILSVPFLVFYAMITCIASLTQDVQIQSIGMLSSIKTILKFFMITVFVTWIADAFFSIVLHRSKGIFSNLLEGLLMFVFFYLYVLVYSLVSDEMVIKDHGCFYVSFGMFLLYLSSHVIYSGAKKLHKVVVKR